MKRTTLISLFSTSLLALAVPACTDPGTDSSTAASTSGTARLAIVVTGDASSSLDLVATDSATGDVAVTQHLTLSADGSVAATVQLPEGQYDFSLSALADDGVTVTAHGNVDVLIAAEATINLNATLDAAAGGGLETEVNTPPAIDGVGVNVIDNLALGLDHLGDATIDAQVSDQEGGQITFFWSGLTLDGSVQGGSSLAIDNDAMVQAQLSGALNLDLGAQFFVVAQDEAGGAALAQVTIGGNGTCLLCGSTTVQIDAGANVGVDTGDVSQQLAACLDAHVSCEASCDAAAQTDGNDTQAQASCNLACGAELADCANE
ncbi:MAG TPA: hypothetical protein VHE35_20230 [Kofleriaceae bacterium]|nr:hypothetical protein [Kofleriaceae bacterium]